MAAERVPMRKLREAIRLRLGGGVSGRAIAQSCRLSVSTVSGYLGRIAVAKLGWPLPAELDDDTVLERLLFPDEHHPVRMRPEPDWAALQRELRRPHVTKQLPLAGVPRGAARRVSVQPVLRAVRSLGETPPAHDAPSPPGGREGVRRLQRRE